VIRVLLADDHRIVREGLRRLLADAPDVQVVGEAMSGAEALAHLEGVATDVVVLDVSMPGAGFSDVLRTMRERHPSVRVIVLSAFAEEEYAVRALKAGASGYVTKERSPEELVSAIRAAAAGRRYVSPSVGELLAAEAARDAAVPARGKLSNRELEVLRLLGAGRSVKEVGADLGISAKTVSTYRTRLLEKLGLTTTADLIRYAIENKLS
jgi:two-component system, NarL family, invasion response regulator UvrY